MFLRRRLSRLAALLALGGLSPRVLPAQTALALSTERPVAPRPAADPKAAYRLRLQSTWPQETDTVDGCRNGGEETVSGTLTRTAAGGYTGTLTRRTRLLFCGSHGPAADRCQLTLEGNGMVGMTGEVVGDDTSPSGRALRVQWTPDSSHQATVKGACPAGFKTAVQQMYLSTPLGVVFPRRAGGAPRRTERLENYAWSVELD
jgi:hypothetical protein